MHPVDGPPRRGAQDRGVGQIQQMHTGRATGLVNGGIHHPHPALHGADQARGQPKHLGRVVQAAEQHLGARAGERLHGFEQVLAHLRRRETGPGHVVQTDQQAGKACLTDVAELPQQHVAHARAGRRQ